MITPQLSFIADTRFNLTLVRKDGRPWSLYTTNVANHREMSLENCFNRFCYSLPSHRRGWILTPHIPAALGRPEYSRSGFWDVTGPSF